MSRISEPLLDRAVSDARGAKAGASDAQARVVWFLGPRPASWNGVMRYSLDCLDMMKRFSDISLEAIDIPAQLRSIRRYWTHFVLYPLRAMRLARKVDLIVLYQEDLAYMIPFVKLAGGRVCIVMHHVVFPDCTRGVIETLKARYMRVLQPLIPHADLVISTTGVTIHDATSWLGVKPERIELVPNAFDACIAPTDASVCHRARLALQKRLKLYLGDAIVLLNVGTDETRKNNATMFRALAELGRKDIVMLCVGKAQNAANRRECEQIARDASMTAHFVEGASDEDLAYCYQAADAYLSPTLHEGFGRTVIEAQLVGLPVIASDLPVYRYTMGDTFLAVKDPKQVAMWRDEIARVADDLALRQDLARRGRKNAQLYSSDSVGRELHRVLRDATRRAKHEADMLARSPVPIRQILPRAEKHGTFGVIAAVLLMLAFASNEALPALGLASISAATTFALAYAGVVAIVLWRPVFSVSMLYLFAISLTVFLGGMGIEAGGYLTETGVQSEANGAFSRLLWFYVIFTLCALAGLERVLPERAVLRERVVPRMTIERSSLMLGFALAAAVLAAGTLAGATEGFALLKGVNRFALRNESEGAGPLFNLFLNNQLFVAVLLGTMCTSTTRWVRWLAMSMAIADIGLEVLHGEQFMSVLGLSLSMLAPFIAVHALNGKPVVRYLGFGALFALLLGSVSVFYAYKGQGLDMSDTVFSRVLLQGQVWYVVDGDAGFFSAPTDGSAAFGRVLNSLASPQAPTFFDDGAVSGLRDVMLAYGTPDILRAYIHDDVTFTMGQMAVLVYWFGFAGAACFIAFTGLVYGVLAALQLLVSMRGGVVLLWLTTKVVAYASFGLQQGEYWNIFGIRTLAYAAIACAWWFCVDARPKQRTWS